MYKVFHRTWWTKEGEPEIGKSTLFRINIDTEKEAREIAEKWNADYLEFHRGYNPQSRKAEFTKI